MLQDLKECQRWEVDVIRNLIWLLDLPASSQPFIILFPNPAFDSWAS